MWIRADTGAKCSHNLLFSLDTIEKFSHYLKFSEHGIEILQNYANNSIADGVF